MRGVGLVMIALLVGCGDDSSSVRDARVDMPPPLDSALSCYGIGIRNICLLNSGTPATRNLTASTINTDTDVECLATYPTVCAIAGGRLTVPGTLTATGSKPLVLVAMDTLTIAGTVDASSTAAGTVGAGSRTACTTANGGTSTTGAGGAAGGTFGGRGGNGGRGANGATFNGTAQFPTTQTTLRGGCGGSIGGMSTVAGGAGGRAGGAVYLIAGNRIEVSGNVYASGAGGGGGGGNAGGGGGGSGGMIGFDAPTVVVTGRVIANGGGGGGGGAGGNVGGPGADGTTATITRATGGTGANSGGSAGGLGAAATTLIGDNAVDATAGGGGGGGGAGIILVYPTQALGGVVSPPQT